MSIRQLRSALDAQRAQHSSSPSVPPTDAVLEQSGPVRETGPGAPKSSRVLIATGRKFGRLTVLAEDESRWRCVCDCGRKTVVSAGNLRSGNTRSCGCLRTRGHRAIARSLGGGRSPEYAAWNAMLQRCHNPKNRSFKNYGARGITVCERWRESFDAFLADVGPRPSPDLSLDREHNDCGYEPGNVRWATRFEQRANRRDSQKAVAS